MTTPETATTLDISTNQTVVTETAKPARKKAKKVPTTKLKRLTSTALLSLTKGDVEDPGQFATWVDENPGADHANYPGWQIFRIDLGYNILTIKARRHTNGGYQILTMDVSEAKLTSE